MTDYILVYQVPENSIIQYMGQKWRVGKPEKDRMQLFGITRRKFMLITATTPVEVLEEADRDA